MIDYSGLLSNIMLLRDKKNTVTYVPKADFPSFPFDTMYDGQYDALRKMKLNEKGMVLSSHTGSGKTAVFIADTMGIATLIIEPRKYLQKQCDAYYTMCSKPSAVMFGKSEYKCKYSTNGTASTSPCNSRNRVKCNTTEHNKKCTDYKKICRRDITNINTPCKGEICDDKGHAVCCHFKPCNLFMVGNEYHRYPCHPCEYIDATITATRTIRSGGTVISNFGNFWNFLPFAKNVVIDEADLFFREISTPRLLHTADEVKDNIKEMLEKESAYINLKLQTATQQQQYTWLNASYAISMLLDNHDICFSYKKRDYKTKVEKVYVEINPDSVNILKDKIFKDKRLVVVTATPTNFDLPSVSYTVPQRCGIFYCPQGKLTYTELKRQPFLLDNAITEFIDPISRIFTSMYGSKKFVIHCGNIGQHATRALQLLGENNCTIHERGLLMQTIEKFLANDKRYLLVASAEYGLDASWCECQFILKFPYANKDERMKALEVKLGKEKFRRWYTIDAINRCVQQTGRVGRGFDSFGATFILDSSFGHVYKQYKAVFPEWFKERLMGDI